jgi:hypothetical protein
MWGAILLYGGSEGGSCEQVLWDWPSSRLPYILKYSATYAASPVARQKSYRPRIAFILTPQNVFLSARYLVWNDGSVDSDSILIFSAKDLVTQRKVPLDFV